MMQKWLFSMLLCFLPLWAPVRKTGSFVSVEAIRVDDVEDLQILLDTSLSKNTKSLAEELFTFEQTVVPSEGPTENPTMEIFVEPTEAPTMEPSMEYEEQTFTPTEEPSEEPTYEHPDKYSMEPSEEPTQEPTYEHPEKYSMEPSEEPTVEPNDEDYTFEPTMEPVEEPSEKMTDKPTLPPVTSVPTEAPTAAPTEMLTVIPTETPTTMPTEGPTEIPSASPITFAPTESPSTLSPSLTPTLAPSTASPSRSPTRSPTTRAPTTLRPTVVPGTGVKTPAPTQASTLTFSASYNIGGIDVTKATDKDKEAITEATKKAMGADDDSTAELKELIQVTASPTLSPTVSSRRRLATPSATLIAKAIVEIIQLVKGGGDAQAVYTQLTQQLKQSVEQNNFTQILQTVAQQLGANQTLIAQVNEVVTSDPVIVVPPTYSPTQAPGSSDNAVLAEGAIIGIAIGGSIGILALLIITFFCLRKTRTAKVTAVPVVPGNTPPGQMVVNHEDNVYNA